MKKISLITFFVLLSFNAQSQLIKMRTTEAKYRIGDRSWTNWTRFEYLAIINADSRNLTIYCEPKEVYEIISKNSPNSDLGIIASFNCVDIKGDECVVELKNDDINQEFLINIKYTNSIMVIKYN